MGFPFESCHSASLLSFVDLPMHFYLWGVPFDRMVLAIRWILWLPINFIGCTSDLVTICSDETATIRDDPSEGDVRWL